MKLSKDQRDAIIDQIYKIGSEKKAYMETAVYEAVAKEEDPFVRFFRKLSKSPKQAAGFCAELMQYFMDLREKQVRRRKDIPAYKYITIPLRNMADQEQRRIGTICGELPVFDCPELDAEVAVRRKKFTDAMDDMQRRKLALDAYVADLQFKVKLLDVPDAVIKLLDDFKKSDF